LLPVGALEPRARARIARNGMTSQKKPNGANGQPPAPQPNRSETPRAIRRPRPSNLMQRISRLLSRWEKEDDDPSSELEELEALRREVDERIAALRG